MLYNLLINQRDPKFYEKKRNVKEIHFFKLEAFIGLQVANKFKKGQTLLSVDYTRILCCTIVFTLLQKQRAQ